MKKIFSKLKKHISTIKNNRTLANSLLYKPIYRVAAIEKNKDGNYEVIAQLIGKSSVFKMKPEEILADDKMTDLFSPRDVRTLTYLGYLDINTPKYKILAKRLSEKDNRMLFAIHKKGEKKLQIKTANEISQNKEILNQIDQQDAHMVGYTIATELMLQEKNDLKKITKTTDKKNNTKE